MDVSRLNALGWKATITLKEGIEIVYRQHFLNAQTEKA
jgi:nucleoside-diphosphate-sugar epimerase